MFGRLTSGQQKLLACVTSGQVSRPASVNPEPDDHRRPTRAPSDLRSRKIPVRIAVIWCWTSGGLLYFRPMSTARQAFGELGERIAERWLRQRGWRVINRRFRNGHRDIDLVVERDGTVAFVEVKARRGDEFGGPVGAVNWRKQKELAKSAYIWIDRHGQPMEQYRFDVVGVLVHGERVRIRHVPDAFRISASA
jgi:putative endonuclease